MGKFDNLNDSQLPALIRRIEKLERGTPTNNAAIGRGGIEVYDGGVITITNGGLSVTGTATITGTLQADGTITFTGTFNQSGPTTFTGDTKLNGPTHINGATDIKGTLSVEGVSTLKGDLNVTTGKVKVGSGLTIDPTVDGGGLSFSSGAKLSNSSGGIALQLGGAVSGVTSSGAFLGSAGASIVTNQSLGIVGVTGKFQLGTVPITANAANVYVDSSGNLFKTS